MATRTARLVRLRLQGRHAAWTLTVDNSSKRIFESLNDAEECIDRVSRGKARPGEWTQHSDDEQTITWED